MGWGAGCCLGHCSISFPAMLHDAAPEPRQPLEAVLKNQRGWLSTLCSYLHLPTATAGPSMLGQCTFLHLSAFPQRCPHVFSRSRNAKNAESRVPLSDLEICAQLFTFLLAGDRRQ